MRKQRRPEIVPLCIIQPRGYYAFPIGLRFPRTTTNENSPDEEFQRTDKSSESMLVLFDRQRAVWTIKRATIRNKLRQTNHRANFRLAKYASLLLYFYFTPVTCSHNSSSVRDQPANPRCDVTQKLHFRGEK